MHLESLADRAERAERERDLLARERVAEERNRIARELHDIVAHSVSVMVIQASAARRNLANRPDEATALLENVERTGRQTMDELRQVLGVLRYDRGQALAVPLPTLADLPALVDVGESARCRTQPDDHRRPRARARRRRRLRVPHRPGSPDERPPPRRARAPPSTSGSRSRPPT